MEVAREHLDRIARLEPKLDAFLHVTAERAMERARAVDAAVAAGETIGPLAGVPVAIKDLLDIEGVPTTCGSRILEGYRPPFTATVVERLEAAGAIVVGQDQHGRVRDGLVHREQRLQADAQSLGPRRGCRAGRRAARRRRWRRAWCRSPSAPTPADPSGSRPRCAASWA